MNNRINGIEQVEQALRVLEGYGYDTKPVWAEHNAWLATMDSGEPTAQDYKWAVQHEPSTVADHHVDGVYEVLTAARCFAGRQYTLSPGQRDVLREQYGLTPTQDVVITNVVVFKGTSLIRHFTLESTEHIDPRRRRHVLVAAVVSAARFFERSAERDKEREEEAEVEDTKRVKKGGKPKTAKGLALQYFE